MKVFVVMANDFPDCVFDNEPQATEYRQRRMREQKEPKNLGKLRVYFQVRPFTLNQEGAPA